MTQIFEPRRRLFKSIFVDGSCLFHCASSLSVRIDYKKLINLFINSGDHLVSASYYTALPNDYDLEEKHKSFLRILKKEVKLKVRSVPLLKAYDFSPQQSNPQAGGRYSKGEDILLAVDMVKHAALNTYDCCILVSGDGDHVPTVNAVQDLGKHVTVAAFQSSLSNALEMEANAVIYLDEVLDSIKLDSKNET